MRHEIEVDTNMMQENRIVELGDELYEALRGCHTLEPLTDREEDITIEDAYHISQRMVGRRVELDGERIIGSGGTHGGQSDCPQGRR